MNVKYSEKLTSSSNATDDAEGILKEFLPEGEHCGLFLHGHSNAGLLSRLPHGRSFFPKGSRSSSRLQARGQARIFLHSTFSFGKIKGESDVTSPRAGSNIRRRCGIRSLPCQSQLLILRSVANGVQATWDTPGFREYHRRMQIFILLYIEGGSYISEDEDTWEFMVLYASLFCPVNEN